jgi:hypothetical protein
VCTTALTARTVQKFTCIACRPGRTSDGTFCCWMPIKLFLTLLSPRLLLYPLDQYPSDMRLSQPVAPTTLLRFPSAFAHLRRAIKAIFEPCVPNLTLKDGAPLPSTRKGESHFISTGAKRRSLFSPLRWSLPASPPWLPGERISSPKPMDVEASNESPIVMLDITVV